MLAAQMAATQMLSMRFARRLLQSQSLPEQDSDERAFNKCARTYTSQVQVLNLNHSSGEQTVTVQNVSVSEGSQTIVASNFNPTSSREGGKFDRCHNRREDRSYAHPGRAEASNRSCMDERPSSP